MIWCIIALLVIMGLIIYAIVHEKESFVAQTPEINAACLFACANFDPDDYAVVYDHSTDIPFYIIHNGPLTDDAKKATTLPNVTIDERENEGWDLGAWKYGINKYYNELSNYSHVILANNSCIYANNWRELLANGFGYDMYGHLKYSCSDDPNGFNLMSWHTIVSNKLFTSKDFKDWFDKLTPTSRDYCIEQHETKFAKHFNDLGYTVGISAYNGKLGYVGGMLKKKEKTPKTEKALRRWMNDYTPPYIYY